MGGRSADHRAVLELARPSAAAARRGRGDRLRRLPAPLGAAEHQELRRHLPPALCDVGLPPGLDHPDAERASRRAAVDHH
eukprot:1001672-Pyramimonas_sp.AAC.1